MQVQLWLFALVSISFSAVAQLLMKIGMTKVRLAASGGGGMILAVATSPYVIGGLALYAVGAVLWLIVLSRLPLSVAYPLVSLAFVFVAFLSWAVLGEHLLVKQIVGIALILVGVLLVGSR